MSRNLFISILSFVLGCIIVFLLTRFSPLAETAKPETTEVVQTPVLSQQFTNPYLFTEASRHLYWKPLENIKPTISSYIDSVIAKHKGIVISYYFRDLTNGQSVVINADELYSPASVMKLPILISALRRQEGDPGYLERGLRYSTEQYGQILNPDCAPLTDNTIYKIQTLIERMIQESDNVSTFMLLDDLGIESVQGVEKDMKLPQMSAEDPMKDILTISQCAAFFRVLYNSTGLKKNNSERALKILTGSKYSRGIRKALPADVPFAQKYGIRVGANRLPNGEYELKQLHQLGIVYHSVKPYLIAVMIKYNNRTVMDSIMFDLGKITHSTVHTTVPADYTLSIDEDVN